MATDNRDRTGTGSRGQIQRSRRKSLDRSWVVWLLGFLVLSCVFLGIFFIRPETGYPGSDQGPEETFPSSSSGLLGAVGDIPVIGDTLESVIRSAGRFPDTGKEIKVVTGRLHHEEAVTWVEGTIENRGNTTYQGLMVYYDLYDGAGNPVGSTYSLVASLPPGGIAGFQTNPVNVSAARCMLKYVIGG